MYTWTTFDKCVHPGNHCLQPGPTFKPPGEPPASLPQVICQSPPHFSPQATTDCPVFFFKPLSLYFALFLSPETVFASVSIYFGFTKGHAGLGSWPGIEPTPFAVEAGFLTIGLPEKSRFSQVCGVVLRFFFFFLMWAVFKSLYWTCYSLLFHALVFLAMRHGGSSFPYQGWNLPSPRWKAKS